MQRYFVNIKNNNIFIITNDDYHHIANVMRMNINDKIEVFYDNKLYLCKIDQLNIGNVIVSIVKELEENSELSINITIAQALVKEEKLDYILQKGTELGIARFIPVTMDRCIIKIDNNKIDKKLSRWMKICKEASEQSKRLVIPSIDYPTSLKKLIKLEFDYKILCSVNEKENNIKRVLHDIKESDTILVVIGPEGGITDAEERLLTDNGFISVSLGSRVLRTETASLFIASIINYELMR